MILDHISNLETYSKGDEKLAAIAAFLAEHPAETLADGRHELGLGIYANVSTSAVRDSGDFEVHRRYADLQLVVDGSEVMEWAHLDDLSVPGEYDATADIQFYASATGSAATLKLYAGSFAVFYPQDGHKPVLRLDHDFSRKVVFKIPV